MCYVAGWDRALADADYEELIERDTLGVLPDGTLKFLYLRDVIPPRLATETFATLGRLRFQRGFRRAAITRSTGGELAFGWIDSKPDGPRRLRPTDIYPLTYHWTLLPLLSAMSNLFVEYLPAEWAAQARAARQNGRMTVGGEWVDPNSVAFHRPGFLGQRRRCLPQPPVFSTITVNRNIICRAHRDSGNLAGLACLSAFGSWKGAELAFPHFALAFPLQPGDVLVADTRTELHGNVAPFTGARISVVAYLRGMVRT